MGSIIASRRAKNGKVILQVELDYKEALELRGCLENVFLFPEDIATTKSNLSCRGRNDNTKYFLIPKELRKDLKFPKLVKCNRVNFSNRTFFVYVVGKGFGPTGEN